MRYILLFWALPLGLFWGWFGLSYYDVNFGYVFLSRAAHEFVFHVYGSILGIEASTIPTLVAKASIVDTALIFSIFGYRRRREIRAWWAQRSAGLTRMPDAMNEAGRAPPAE